MAALLRTSVMRLSSTTALTMSIKQGRISSLSCFNRNVRFTSSFNSIVSSHNPSRDGMIATGNRVTSVHRAVTHVQKAMLSTAVNPEFQDLVEMAEAHLDLLLNEKLMWVKQLVLIRENPQEDIMRRWQMALQIYVASQAHTIVSYGYAPGMPGIHQHMTDYVDASDKHERGAELLVLQTDRWNAVLQQAFGTQLGNSDVSVEQARHYSGMLTLKLQSAEFLNQVDEAMANLDSTGTAEEIQVLKSSTLMELLSPLQKELCESFGFAGDEGFIKLQVALLDHQRDDQIIYNTMNGMATVFKRAGIDIPSA